MSSLTVNQHWFEWAGAHFRGVRQYRDSHGKPAGWRLDDVTVPYSDEARQLLNALQTGAGNIDGRTSVALVVDGTAAAMTGQFHVSHIGPDRITLSFVSLPGAQFAIEVF